MEGEGGIISQECIIPFDYYQNIAKDGTGIGRNKTGYVVGSVHRKITLIEALPLTDTVKDGTWAVMRREEISYVGPDLFQILWDITLTSMVGQIMPDGSVLTPITATALLNDAKLADKINTPNAVYRKKRKASSEVKKTQRKKQKVVTNNSGS